MSKLTNLFEDFRDYQSRKVDNPSYEPLGQPILEQTPTKEEILSAKRRDYQKKHYEEHKEKIKQYMRDYYKWKRTNKEHNLKWIQLCVYNYMVEQSQLWDRVPRGTQIAKALNVWEQTVYNAVSSLIRKWYVWRWAMGKYYLINPPKQEEELNKEIWTNDIGLIAEQAKNKWYMDSLADMISSWLIEQNKRLYEENLKLKATLQKIKDAWMKHEKSVDVYYKQWQDSYSDLDSIIMNR